MQYEELDGMLKRYELVELVIPAGSSGTRFPYPDIPQLRDDTTQDIIICGLETFSVDAMPLSPNGNAVATMLQLQNSFLTLYIDGEESIRQLFLPRLNPMWQTLNTGTTFHALERIRTKYIQVDWNKSYIQAATPYGAPLATQFSIMLGVWYKKLLPGSWDQMTKGMVQGW
jgi:hypothetical protein